MDRTANLPTPPSTGNSSTWPALSERAKAFLTDDHGALEVICALVLADPELAREVAKAAPELRRIATAPAGRDGVMDVIGRRLVIYPQRDMTEGEWTAWWDAYVAALGSLPWAQLEAGMRRWVAAPESEFMPKPGALKAMSQQVATPDSRAATVAGLVARALAAPVRPPSSGGYLDEIRAMPKPGRVVPPPPVKPSRDPSEKAAMVAKLRAMADAEDATDAQG